MTEDFPCVTSERLVFRLLELPDLKAVIKYWSDNQAHLASSGPLWPPEFLSNEFWIKQIKQNQLEFQHGQSFRGYVFSKSQPDEIVGHISFSAVLRSAAQFCFLGYGLAQDKQGQGYMSEILKAALSFAFDELHLHRVAANYMPTNVRSGQLLKRLGFTVEGYARDYLYLNGKWEDHILTAIINPNWST